MLRKKSSEKSSRLARALDSMQVLHCQVFSNYSNPVACPGEKPGKFPVGPFQRTPHKCLIARWVGISGGDRRNLLKSKTIQL